MEISEIREAKRLLGKASKAISSASWHTRTAVDCVETIKLPMTEIREFSGKLRKTLEELYKAETDVNLILDRLYRAT